MSYCNESKTLAQTKIAELARKERLAIAYAFKDRFYEKAIAYMRLQDYEECISCEDADNIKIKIK